MTIIQIIDAFTFYGLDIFALSAATCLAVQLLKRTLMRGCQKKIFTLMPFLTGTLFYAAYAAICNLSACFVLKNYTVILEHGVSVGALSTVVYVWYEQFVRESGKNDAIGGVISTLIEGYVPTDAIEHTSSLIAEAIKNDVTGDGAHKAAEILAENSADGVTERDIKLLAKLIIETLAHISAAKR